MVVKLNWLVRCVICANRGHSPSFGSAMSVTTLSDAMNASISVAASSNSTRAAFSRYIAVRRVSSSVTVILSKVHRFERNDVTSPAVGSCNVTTCGNSARISAHSTGLSSMKTNESKPRLSERANPTRLLGFGSQFIRRATTCSSLRTMSGRFSKTSTTSCSTFLLARQISVPFS